MMQKRIVLAAAWIAIAIGQADAQSISDQAQRCVPNGVSGQPKEAIDFEVTIDASGQVADFTVLSGNTGPQWRSNVTAAGRAIRRCSPYPVAAGEHSVTISIPVGSPKKPIDPFKGR